MKRFVPTWSFVAVAAVALLVAATFAVRAAETDPATPLVTSLFKVEGMTCGGCEAGVKMTVGRLDGVREVEASYKEERASVTYDSKKVTPQAIVEAIDELGFRAELVATKPAAPAPETSGLLAKLRACC